MSHGAIVTFSNLKSSIEELVKNSATEVYKIKTANISETIKNACLEVVSNLKEKELPSPICPKEFTGSESDSGIKSESGSSVKVEQ